MFKICSISFSNCDFIYNFDIYVSIFCFWYLCRFHIFHNFLSLSKPAFIFFQWPFLLSFLALQFTTMCTSIFMWYNRTYLLETFWGFFLENKDVTVQAYQSLVCKSCFEHSEHSLLLCANAINFLFVVWLCESTVMFCF